MGKAVVDANLLLLLIVGRTNRDLIFKHKRLDDKVGAERFDWLDNVLTGMVVVTTPHVLTEVSNLIDYFAMQGGDHRDDVARFLREQVPDFIEIYDPGTEIVAQPEYMWLGIADIAVIMAAREADFLVTMDSDVHNAALKRDIDSIHIDQELYRDA